MRRSACRPRRLAQRRAQEEGTQEEKSIEASVDMDTLMRSVLAGWKDDESRAATVERLSKMEEEHDANGMDAPMVKEALTGCWKLMATTEPDGVLAAGVSGLADSPYALVTAQYQTFRKPDPMDVLTGNTFFMETSEVVVDVLGGNSSVATARGGFRVEAGSSGGAQEVTEYYSRLELDGQQAAEVPEEQSRWACVYLSREWRICGLPDGSRRTYAKVDGAAAREEMDRLRGLTVPIDPAAAAQWVAANAKAPPPPPPVDTRPKWQRETEDGGRFTRNGGNFGPITG